MERLNQDGGSWIGQGSSPDCPNSNSITSEGVVIRRQPNPCRISRSPILLPPLGYSLPHENFKNCHFAPLR